MVRKIFSARILPVAMIAYVTIACLVAYLFMEYSGDDLSYLSAFNGLNGCATGYYNAVADFFPRWVVRHWVYGNGRFANNLFAFNALWFPSALNAVVVAVGIGAMMWLMIKLARFGSECVTGKMFLIAILAFALPWWDSFMVYDVVYNYVLSSLLVLGMVGVFIYKKGWILNGSGPMLVVWCCLSFFAGGMHEAASMPILVAAIVYLWLTDSYTCLDRRLKLVGGCFAVGSLWCFLSPGIWMRFGSLAEPDDPLWLLLLKSDLIPMLLYLFLFAKALTVSGRHELMSRIRTPWMIFALASFGAFLFSAVSGIVGRSGWFATLYALVALFMWGNMSGCRIKAWMGGVLSFMLAAFLTVHYFEFVKWQIRVGKEAGELVDLYSDSASGIVYLDTTADTDVPLWVLSKTRGVPDADDYYQKLCFDGYYGGGKKKLVVLPSDVKDMKPDEIGEGITLRNGDRITAALPSDVYTHFISRENGELLLMDDDDGRKWVVTPFDIGNANLYHITPRIMDPGDR